MSITVLPADEPIPMQLGITVLPADKPKKLIGWYMWECLTGIGPFWLYPTKEKPADLVEHIAECEKCREHEAKLSLKISE